MGCSSMEEVPAWVMGMPGLRVPFEERRVRVREEGQETEAVVRVRPDLVDLSGRKSMVELPVWLQEGAGNVQELAVSSNELKVLPGWLGDLMSLKVLILRWCSGLTGLPESVGGLTALQVLSLEGCSALYTPPPAVVRAGRDAVQQYLRDLAKGSAPCHLLKLVLVGEPHSGKSSLADSLVQRRPATRAHDDRTVGIEVRRWWLGACGVREGDEDEEEVEEEEEEDEDEDDDGGDDDDEGDGDDEGCLPTRRHPRSTNRPRSELSFIGPRLKSMLYNKHEKHFAPIAIQSMQITDECARLGQPTSASVWSVTSG